MTLLIQNTQLYNQLYNYYLVIINNLYHLPKIRHVKQRKNEFKSRIVQHSASKSHTTLTAPVVTVSSASRLLQIYTAKKIQTVTLPAWPLYPSSRARVLVGFRSQFCFRVHDVIFGCPKHFWSAKNYFWASHHKFLGVKIMISKNFQKFSGVKMFINFQEFLKIAKHFMLFLLPNCCTTDTIIIWKQQQHIYIHIYMCPNMCSCGLCSRQYLC